MKRNHYFLWVVLLLFLTNSCNIDSLDFSKLSDDVNINPSMVAPVAKANVSVWDLLQSANQDNKDVITKDPTTGLVKIIYTENDLYKYNLSDFLDLPNQQNFSSGDKQLGEISPADVSVTRNITLSDLANSVGGSLSGIGAYNNTDAPFPSVTYTGSAQYNLNQITDFTWISLNKGSLTISMENKLKVPVTIKGTLYDTGYNRKVTDFTFSSIAPNATSNTTVDLTGLQISNKVEFRMMSFDTPGSATPVRINVNDYFKLSFDLKGLKISKGNLMVKSQVLEGYAGAFSFVFPEPEMKAFEATMKKGAIIIKATNSSKVSGTINLTLNQVKKNGVPITASIPLTGTSTSIDLSGAVFNFASDPLVPYNRIPYTYSLQVNNSGGYIDYLSTDAIKLDITLSNLGFKSVQGDFGKRTINIDKGYFDMNVDMLDKIEGNFKLVNPKVNLIIHNSIGIPATGNLNLTASNRDGKTESLNPQPFDVPVPANLNAGVATKTIVFDKQNSNIVNLVALPPTGQVSYSGVVSFNANNQVTQQNPNFMDIDGTFSIDLAMELPMEMQISNLAFKDTSSISGDDFDKLESAELTIIANNGIPLDIDMQLFFIDSISKKQYGSSKKTKIMTAAQVNSSGVITPVQSTQTFSLDKSEMENLRKANAIVFSGTVSSPSGGTGVATIYSNSKIDLSVVIKSKVNL